MYLGPAELEVLLVVGLDLLHPLVLVIQTRLLDVEQTEGGRLGERDALVGVPVRARLHSRVEHGQVVLFGGGSVLRLLGRIQVGL